MTDIKRQEITSGALSVVLEESRDADGKPVIIISSNKNKGKYRIRKSNDGFAFFVIDPVSCALPKTLTGTYSRTKYAVEDVIKHLKQAKMSASAKYENNHKDK